MKYLVYKCYLNNISYNKMSELTGVKYYTLCRVHRKYNISSPKRDVWNKKMTDDIAKTIIKRYQNGETGGKIADSLGYKRKETIYQILEKNGIKRKAPKIYTYYEEDFFKKIDSHNKAYILGLIMTDGYIIKDYDGFGIQLTKEDGYILEKIRDLIGGVNPITQIDCSKKREVLKGARDMARLHVFSKKIAEDLKILGVVKRKTKILRYNDCVPNEFLNSFFRGLIDGDGTIGKSSRGYYWAALVSASKEFIEDLCVPEFDWGINKTTSKNGNYIYALRIKGGQKEIVRFYSWIYKDKGDLYLRRKYAKVQDKIN